MQVDLMTIKTQRVYCAMHFRFRRILAMTAAAASVALAAPASTDPGWSRFRGLLWRVALPPGHSSPVIHGNRIYRTAFRRDTLITMAIDRTTGRPLRERQAREVKTTFVDQRNSPASPSPAAEENAVFVHAVSIGVSPFPHGGCR